MNKKLLLGCFGVCSVVSLLVACGSGTIDPFVQGDDVAAVILPSALDADKSMTACLANAACAAQMEAAVNPPSSAVVPSSSSIIPLSSSSPINPNSSSSLIALSSGGVPVSSSSLIVVSSSSITPEGGIAGTCAPTPAVAELGSVVTWTFTKAASVPVTEIMAATFDWVFEGGSLGEFRGAGATAISKTVTYSASGSHVTTLSINETAPTVCAPVQVNGAKITGCACTVDKASPDVAAGGVATWTVAGCASTANIIGYTWNGGALGDAITASHTFVAKDETFTPTLTVSNDDNTVQTVVCPAAKAIDASLPDYELKAPNEEILLPAGTNTSIAMGASTSPGGCQFYCKQSNGTPFSGTINGKDYACTSGCYHFDMNAYVTTASCSGSLSFSTTAEVTCGANWW